MSNEQAHPDTDMSLVEFVNQPANNRDKNGQPIDKPSEDALGYDLARKMIWVIDGASDDYIDMPRHQETGRRLDAFWAANTLSTLFHHHAETALNDTRQYFRDVLTDFTHIFEKAAGQPIAKIPREKHPIAAFAWMRYDEASNSIMTAGLCDSMVMAKLDNGRFVANTPTADGAAEAARDKKLAQETGSTKLDRTQGPVYEHLLQARREKNDFENDGDAVLGPCPEAADHILVETIDLDGAKPKYALATSDGMLRLCDTFETYSDYEELFNTVLAHGPIYIIEEELRPLERGDETTPRVKAHDDAAAALFEFK